MLDNHADSIHYGAASRAAAQYGFARTTGRGLIIAAYDVLFAALEARSLEHEAHENRDLREFVSHAAQRTMTDFEALCRKWIESDERGLTY
jgi:hypothetical protein